MADIAAERDWMRGMRDDARRREAEERRQARVALYIEMVEWLARMCPRCPHERHVGRCCDPCPVDMAAYA